MDPVSQVQELGAAVVLFVEVVLMDIAVGQGDGGGVGHTVVGGFAALGMPLFGVAGHNVDGFLEGADVHRGNVRNGNFRHLFPGFQGGLHYGLGILAQGETLDATFGYFVGLPVAAERLELIGFAAGYGADKAVFALENGLGAGQAALGEAHGKEGVAAGVGVSAAFPVGQDAAPGLAQGNVGGQAEVQGLVGLFRVQAQGPGGAEDAGDAAVGDMVIAPVAEGGGVAEAAKGFVGGDGGGDGAAAAQAGEFSCR